MSIQQSPSHDSIPHHEHPVPRPAHEQVTIAALLIGAISLALLLSAAAIQHA